MAKPFLINEERISNKIELSKNITLKSDSVLKITLKQKIVKYRNHDYTWKILDKTYTSNPYCPKILITENGEYIQPNINIGIWEIDAKRPYELIWKFNPYYSTPIINYDKQNLKEISLSNYLNTKNVCLLFSKQNALEVSRSQIPFSAIACFTDHCDFDTLENLRILRPFFKRHNIKTTKGFFLNHYSKREDNASFEHHSEEIEKWRNDGHELVYHSLTQSIREFDLAIQEFKEFEPPFEINTWIDHGFQPYNFTLFKKSKITNKDYESLLVEKNIKNLWNYLDSGTSTSGVINQLNTSQFTLSKYLKGIKGFSLQTQIKLFLKLLLIHYFSKPEYQKVYKDLAVNFKKIRYQKQFKSVFKLIINVFSLMKILFGLLINWNKVKNIPFEHSKYAPVLFKHIIDSKKFTIFQTLEMVDFVNSLKKGNIDSIIEEKGLFIAHTYFSVPMKYHTGRMIINNKINPKVEENFQYLSEQIKLKKIWNPTLKELSEYLCNFEDVEFDLNEKGEIYCTQHFDFNIRTAN